MRKRSLRMVLVQGGLALLLLPLLLVGIAALYERWMIREHRAALVRAGEAALRADAGERARLAAHLHAAIVRLDARGAAIERAGGATALERSPLGAVGERLVGAGGGRGDDDSLLRADAMLPPWTARDEVEEALAGRRAFGQHLTPDGAALLVTFAEPLPDGGVLYLISGSRRGIRRLALVRRQLYELLLYELVLAVPLVVVFAVGLVRPLERLAAGARRYPAAPLADATLLRRRDEIGALARTLTEMAADLDGRRRAAADLGADIAHEFKNPLATIAASAELLLAGTAPPARERVELCAGTIAGSVERLRRSIDDLLAYLRLEQAMPGESREPAPYGALLGELADEYRRDPRAGGWTFVVDATAEAAACAPALNRRRWAEMLRNLIDNALVQPAPERRIVIGARLDGGKLLVTTVRDSGPGISRENQARIFRRFFTQRPAGAPPGTGLGLSIVDSVARAHGGRVEVSSEPGQGAEFRVVLPV